VQIRSFGSTDLKVSELGLGCARIGGIFQGDSGGFVDLLSAAFDGGINFFDTADMYSQGESEQLIGRTFRGRRDRVIIATKAGYCLPAQRRLAARLKPILRPVIRRLGLRRASVPSSVRGQLAQDFSPEYLKNAVEGSLRRLRTDYVDLFQLHSPPRSVVERDDWVSALERLKESGKIRHYGVSCDDFDAGLAALRLPGLQSVQVLLNLLDQGATERLLPAARDRGVGVIARETLANGMLVKSAAALDLKQYCKSPEEEAKRAEQLTRYRQAAASEGRPLPAFSLKYVTGLAGVAVALIGVSKIGQLQELLRLAGE
jgi:aryl-alcohol dehydrogenase-like predicted oxidoreductase